MVPLWVLQAGQWFRKNWRWVVFPLGIAAAVLGWTRRTNVTLASSTLIDADQTAKRLADEAAAKEKGAELLRDVKIVEADHTFEVTVEALQTRQEAAAAELTQDPDALNRVLLDVGKRQRDPS